MSAIDSTTAIQAYGTLVGSNAAATRQLLRELGLRGEFGRLAQSLFRAQKASERAKRYRGYSDSYYEKKGEQLNEVVDSLFALTDELPWGWGIDEEGYHRDVLYVDLPTGQASFHHVERLSGPDYPGEWDHNASSAWNICAFIEWAFESQDPRPVEKKPRTINPKRLFTCESCKAEKRSSRKSPPGWLRVFYDTTEYIVCSEPCHMSLLRELDYNNFADGTFRMPSGKHEGELLTDLDADYISWVARNVTKKSSLIYRAASYEVLRRRKKG